MVEWSITPIISNISSGLVRTTSRNVGLVVAELLKQGTEFRVTHAELRYRSAGKYGETLDIETTLTADRRISITFSHLIREQTTHRLVVEGSATLVAVDSQGKVKRLSPALLEALDVVSATSS